MGEQKEDLYHNFSRKDLQGLCKKYGLPANKSNSEMATSLILYLEKKSLNSRTIWEKTRSDPFASVTPELQAGVRIDLTGDRGRDCRRTMSHSGLGNNRSNNRDVQQNDLQNCKDPATSDKASDDVGILTHVHNHSNSGAGLPENALSSVVSPHVGAPSSKFQFEVSCEDGIQLFVDLKSNSSDWIERLKSGVHLCHDMDELKSSSFNQELCQLCSSKHMKGSSLTDSYQEMDNRDVEDRSYPTIMGEGAQAQADEPDGGEGTLSSPGVNLCSDNTHGLENVGEAQATNSSRLEFDIGKQVCGVKSCVIREEAVPAGPDVNVGTQIKTCHNFSGNSLSIDPKGSGMLENQVINVGNRALKKQSLQKTYGPRDPVLNCKGPSKSSYVEKRAPRGTKLGQDKGDGLCLDSADQPQSSGTEYCGLTNSALVNRPPSDLIGGKQHRVDSEHGKGFILSQSSRKITGVPKHLGSSHRKSTTLSPYQRHESLGVVNLSKSIETKTGGILRPHGVGQEPLKMHSFVGGVEREDALVSHCRNGGAEHLVVPNRNGASHCTPAFSTELNEDIPKSQSTTILGDLGRSNARDGRESSECLDFRDSLEETWRKPADSESNRELKGKRQIISIEDQTQSVKSNAKISRTSKQFPGDVRASRRRSSRLFTK